MTLFSPTRRSLLGAALALPLSARASTSRLQVVASFSILADLAQQVGGDVVDVAPLVGPNGDAHVFEPSAQDAMKLQQAAVLVTNGLGFEGWMPRLKSASGFKGLEIVASRGVTPRSFVPHVHVQQPLDVYAHQHAEDPHAWQDVRNVVNYVHNIAEGFAEADPANAAHYRTREAVYVARLEALDARIRTTLGQLPQDRRSAVTAHEAFGYYAQAYGLRLVPARGLSTESELSARDMARLIELIRKERIQAIFVENISDPRLMEQLTRETGAVIGDKLYSDALSPPGGAAGTYIALMESNTAAFFKALQRSTNAGR